MSTKSGKYTNLDFVDYEDDYVNSLFFIKPVKSAILRIKAGKEVPWHHDGVSERDTVVIFPLSPYGGNEYSIYNNTSGYAGASLDDGSQVPWLTCYAFNTQRKHAVYNNMNDRISLQLFYNMPIEQLHELYVENMLLNKAS